MKRILASVLLFSVLSLSVLSAVSCGRDSEPKSKSYFGLFDTVTTVYDYTGGSNEDFIKTSALIYERLSFYDRLFDIYEEHTLDDGANIYTVNSLAGEEAVRVPSQLIDFLDYAKEMHTLTDGNVNIAMGAVLSLWHNCREAAKGENPVFEIPDENALRRAGEHCDITKIRIDRNASSVMLLDPEMSLDVGAIAKGYATERVAEELLSLGISGYVLDVGGNLRAVGSKPSGKGWSTGVRNPDSVGNPYVYTFEIKDTSAVTSGDYERYYIVNGKKYHHIINKDTLMPSDKFRSVTVVTRDGGLADALSTALFNMDYETGRSLVESLDDTFAVWVFVDGGVFIGGKE